MKEKKTKGKKGKSPVSPSMGGAAKKFAANALPVSRVTTQKAKEKRRLPTYCDARGHGHCEWDGVTPLKEHPKLKHVCICVGCYDFYHAMHFTVGKDGYYNQCRCCSDGGGDDVIVCCDTCAQVFCKNCIANLGGKEYCNDVGKVDTWRCFSCDPKAVAKKR
ncbi:hypothetical protein N9L76_02050 [bacterium]|nr:hypothetical protein [bacterium]